MYLSLVLVVSALVCAYAALWVRGRRERNMLKGLPTFFNVPFLGCTLKIIGGPETMLRLVEEVKDAVEMSESPFVVWAGPVPVLAVISLEDVKLITNAFVEKPYYYDFTKMWVEEGLFSATGAIWKRNIKKLAGAFTGPIVDGYQDIFNDISRQQVEKMKIEIGKEPFDVFEKYLTRTTFGTICKTALGIPKVSEAIKNEYFRAMNRLSEMIMERATNILLHLDWVYRLTPGYREFCDCVTVLHGISEAVIDARLKERNEKPEKKQIYEDPMSRRFKSFLDILLDVRETDEIMTLRQIRAEVDTIIFAGQDTSASATSFALILLGSHQEAQDKLYAEIREIFGDSKRPVEKEDLSRLKYCECVIYETLRLYPPGAVLFRKADRDLKISRCTVPAGIMCALNIWGVGRSRKLWGADAGEFRPERWLQPGIDPMLASGALAFSSGRRACIGKKYSMALIKTMLVHLLRELKFSSEAHKLKVRMDFVTKSIAGNLVSVECR